MLMSHVRVELDGSLDWSVGAVATLWEACFMNYCKNKKWHNIMIVYLCVCIWPWGRELFSIN